MANPNHSSPAPALPRSRRWPTLAGRLALLVAVPLAFFCGLEAALRLAGFGGPTDLFVPDDRPGFYRTNPRFTVPFIPESFGIQPLALRIRRHKEPGALRVFVLGESAAQGIPDPEFGFASLLRAQLRSRFPGRTVEVFNLGITAVNSHVVYQAARQATALEPDLLVVYMGNNEVVGPYGPGCAYLSAAPPLWFIRASVWVRGTRTGQLMARIAARLLPAGRSAREWKGMETFSENSVRGDDPRLQSVYAGFAENLRGIIGAARRSGVRVVLATVAANLADSPPFISLNRAGMSPAEQKAWRQVYDAGIIAWDLGDSVSARAGFAEAVRIDPQFAEAHYRLGRIDVDEGDEGAARAQFLDALHWDALRFRPDAPINQAIRGAASSEPGTVTLVDVARVMGSDPVASARISGRSVLFDHVHFTWGGNVQVARLLAGGCLRALGAPESGALDEAACAAAVGYVPEARLKMLQTVVQLTVRPPFTSQSSFSEDQGALRREIGDLTGLLSRPGERAAELSVVRRAHEFDPANGSLALRLATMEAEAGNSGVALLDSAEELLPGSADLDQRKAQVMEAAGRLVEAEDVLTRSIPRDEQYFSAGRPLVELWAKEGQLARGKAVLEGLLARFPSNPYLRLEYARLLARMGDRTAAEREARGIWEADPTGRPAMASLELLVQERSEAGDPAGADALSLQARPLQPYDYFNNERLAAIFSARKDASQAADSLRALAVSGPFDSQQHLDLAHRLADLNRGMEMLDELSHARGVARVEGDDAQLARIEKVIAAYRERFAPGQGP
jgi:tetratricopeptide (TPR) repeat protein